MSAIKTIDWLNLNKFRVYPFCDNSDLTLFSGHILSNAAILDASIVSYSAGQHECRLVGFSVLNDDQGLSFEFQYNNAAFYVFIPPTAWFPCTVNGRQNGFFYNIVFGDGCNELYLLGEGYYQFKYPPKIQPSLIIVQNSHQVNSISSGDQNDILTGKIKLDPGYNCNPLILDNTIYFDVGLGKGAGRYHTNQPNKCSEVLLRINGQTGNDNGDFVIAAGQGVMVESDQENHTINIKCNLVFNNTDCG